MAIDIEVRASNANVIDAQPNYRAAPESSNFDRFPLLGSIADAGDTVFNVGQMRRMVAEIRSLREFSMTPEQTRSLDGLERLCRDHGRRLHRYLWFVGD